MPPKNIGIYFNRVPSYATSETLHAWLQQQLTQLGRADLCALIANVKKPEPKKGGKAAAGGTTYGFVNMRTAAAADAMRALFDGRAFDDNRLQVKRADSTATKRERQRDAASGDAATAPPPASRARTVYSERRVEQVAQSMRDGPAPSAVTASAALAAAKGRTTTSATQSSSSAPVAAWYMKGLKGATVGVVAADDDAASAAKASNAPRTAPSTATSTTTTATTSEAVAAALAELERAPTPSTRTAVPALLRTTDLDTDAHKIAKRVAQVLRGKVTSEYLAYTSAIPREQRAAAAPRTPDVLAQQSHNQFEGRISSWRASLHTWCAEQDALTTRARADAVELPSDAEDDIVDPALYT